MRKTPLKRVAFRPKQTKRQRDAREMKAAERDMGPKRCALYDIVTDLSFFGFHAGCQGRMVRHHVLPRSRGGTNDAANLIWLCDAGHRWVHEHPEHARKWGLLR